jgi:hypothetical protein
LTERLSLHTLLAGLLMMLETEPGSHVELNHAKLISMDFK